MVALAQALKSRGHSVSFAVPPSSLAFARAFGLEAFPVGIDYEEVSRRAANGSFREVVGLLPMLRSEVAAQYDGLEAHAAQADVIAGSSVFTVGSLFSERFGKPSAFFMFCPALFPSALHPSPAVRWQTLPRWFNRLSWVLNKWLWERLYRRPVNTARARSGLAPVKNVWSALMGGTPVLACDEALATAPADHDVPVTQVGSMVLRDESALSPEVSAFLAAGPPPVYIGFGSMSDPDPTATSRRLLESVRRAGVRALISSGWAGLRAAEPPPGVLFVGPEPHGKLFPRCAAVVHHGGAGTTHAAARAGVPQVLMPQLLDQHYWAHRVTTSGLGLRLGRHAKNPALLADALRGCTRDETMQARARALADSMKTNGAERAAELLERAAS